ncbi:MAG: ABC transporter permease [Burkholderiales bacterium]
MTKKITINRGRRLLLDVSLQAWYSLGDRRLRTLLSIFGIAIGVSAVTLIDVVTHGGREKVYAELQTFGLRSVWIMRDNKITDPLKLERSGTGIDNTDYDALRDSSCCRTFTRISPLVFGTPNTNQFARANGRFSQVQLEGVNEEYIAINNDHIVRGRPFSAADIELARPVAIIGIKVKNDLFGSIVDPIGRELRLDNRTVEVIGVLASKDRSLLTSIGSGQDANGRMLMPYTRLQLMRDTTQIDLLQGEVRHDISAAITAQSAANFLRYRHQDSYAYRVDTMEQYVQTANNILEGVTIIGMVAASVSLFVAGLGILNIMSTAVLERTREIGVRKALGGDEWTILLQFLIEAMLISLFGGVAGLLLGGITSIAVAWIAGFPLEPKMLFNGLSLVIAVGVGLVSGLYPAYRAAQLRPVEALRYE